MRLYITILLFFSLQVSLWADPTTDYTSQPLASKGRLSEEGWKKSVSAIDYTPRPKEPPKQRTNTDPTPVRNWSPQAPRANISAPNFSGTGDFMRILIIGGIIVLAAVVLFGFIMRSAGNKTVKRRPEDFKIEEIEANLHEAEIDRFLREALAQQNYRLAVRLYFLAIMKELSLKKIIEWQRDKTNGAYLREVRTRKREWFDEMAQLVIIFEYAWYSEAGFSANDFAQVDPMYRAFLKKVS